ncbi:hypothetical protein [Streptomyces sp. SID3212]|uniref:hypothetical protein n=1 Tax=Streptomyces sp. SID3212 TaxID=2690259 RepID=UPI00136AEA9C|nr:hypothetical protein [Streptomyces sp. SID3212]MYV56480.1 hypothetical protein [Streptomyces sp. SID3212]
MIAHSTRITTAAVVLAVAITVVFALMMAAAADGLALPLLFWLVALVVALGGGALIAERIAPTREQLLLRRFRRAARARARAAHRHRRS